MIERLKSGEALLAAIATLAATVLQYFAIPNIIEIPDNISPLYQFLTTGLMVVLILIVLLLLPEFAGMNILVQVCVILGLIAIGIASAVTFANQLQDHSFSKTCIDEPRVVILTPSVPSQKLRDEMMLGGGLENGWCNHQDPAFFRALVRDEAVADATIAGLKLLVSQLLLALGLIIALLSYMARRDRN